jgi:diacylglycerol kinase family enzyme
VAGVAVVVNPHAAGNRAEDKRVERLRKIVGNDGIVIETPTVAALSEVAHELKTRGIDIVTVCGGDGSYFHTLSALIRAYGEQPLPLFLPLRAGTMNTMMRSIGARWRRPERMLAHVMTDYRHGRTHEVTERHLLRINGQHYAFMFGAGPIVNFVRLYYASERRGPRRAAWLILLVSLSVLLRSSLSRGIFQSTEADIVCDDERVPFRRFNIIYASTLVDIGLGFKPTYLATRKRGFFHLIAGPFEPMEILRKLWRMRRGFPTDSAQVYDNIARRVVIEFAAPSHYLVDGEILGPVTQVTIETGPRLGLIRG